METTELAIQAADVREAAGRIAPLVRRTPALFDEVDGRRVFFKCENLQRGGAFKIRGAANLILSLTPEQLRRGIVT
jgi:threonine dehydratase